MATIPADDEGVSAWEQVFAGQGAPADNDTAADAKGRPAAADAPGEPAAADAPSDAPGEPAAADAPEDDPQDLPIGVETQPSLLRPALAALVVVALIASGTVAVLQWRRANHLSGTESDRRTIAVTSGAFAQALLTYDYTNLNGARSSVLRMATPTFAQNYTTAFTNGLGAAITQLKAKSTATVRKVFVSDTSGNNADAVVTIDSTVHSTAGTRQVVGSYLDIVLARQAGQWKVSQVTSVAASSDNLTPAAGAPATGSTPSTTAPPTVTTAPGG